MDMTIDKRVFRVFTALANFRVLHYCSDPATNEKINSWVKDVKIKNGLDRTCEELEHFGLDI